MRRAHEVDMWALCGECERWFYCEGWLEEGTPEPTCPVCAREPEAVVNRAVPSPAEVAEENAAAHP